MGAFGKNKSELQNPKSINAGNEKVNDTLGMGTHRVWDTRGNVRGLANKDSSITDSDIDANLRLYQIPAFPRGACSEKSQQTGGLSGTPRRFRKSENVFILGERKGRRGEIVYTLSDGRILFGPERSGSCAIRRRPGT